MTQITVTLEKGADSNFIRKIFENVKGVLSTSITDKVDRKERVAPDNKPVSTSDIEKREWMHRLDQLCENVDRSVVDMNDEKTRYLLSK